MNNPHAGDFGTVYTFLIIENGAPVDISAATTKLVILLRPDGSFKSAAGVFVTNGTDGKLQYTTIAGDLPQTTPGKYSFQVKIGLPSGQWYTTDHTVEVLPDIAPV